MLIACLTLKFPSPLGASYFQMRPKKWQEKEWLHGFRPLSGHLISKWYVIWGSYIFLIRFPSPLGASYFQIFHKTYYSNNYLICFRPLSGHLISKYQPEIHLHPKMQMRFPSPLGASYFQILPARARYFAGFSDSFAWQIIFLYIFLISNIHNRLQMQYLCGAWQNYLFF